MSLQFVVGYDLEKFKRYYRELSEDAEWRGTFGWTEELGEEWERLLAENPSWLIVWWLDGEVVGHAVWHPSSTEEETKGVPREKGDRENLERILGARRSLWSCMKFG